MIKGSIAYARGRAHVRCEKKNQDAYCILPFPDQKIWVAAVADGVGSAKHAERGSDIATETAVNFIYENLPLDHQDPISTKSMLRTAFNRALKEIKKEAYQNGHDLSDYDTTLMAVLWDGRQGYIAHTGDGGIIALKKDGSYVELSQCQRSAEGYVIPLRAGYQYWQITELESAEEYASILLATDGIMDQFRSRARGIYVPLIMLFGDPNVIEYLRKRGVSHSSLVTDPRASSRAAYNAIYHALRKAYGFKKAVCLNIVNSVKAGDLPIKLLEAIQDDITCVCLYNTEARPSARDARYYREPDWKSLYAKRQKLLYPELASIETSPPPEAKEEKPDKKRKSRLLFGKVAKRRKK